MAIKSRQICFILVAYTAASKLLMFPTILSTTSGPDLLWPALFDFLVCTAVIWSISYLSSKTDKTFFGLLEGTIGNIGARIVYGFFAAFFLIACLLPVFEQKSYVHNIFYDTVPSLGVFLPVFIFTAFAGSKNLKNVGRCADICLPIFIVVMIFLFIMAYAEVRWDNLLPMFKTPFSKLAMGAGGTAYNFAEPCWLLMFLGHFKHEKGDTARITLSYAAGALITLAFLAVFYGLYGPIAPSRTFAVARTSLFFPAIETIGRVDLIILFVLETVMLFALVLNIQLAVYAIKKCTGYQNGTVISIAVSLALMIILIFCDHYYNAIYEFYYGWLWIVFVLFAVVIPPMAWLLKRRTGNAE